MMNNPYDLPPMSRRARKARREAMESFRRAQAIAFPVCHWSSPSGGGSTLISLESNTSASGLNGATTPAINTTASSGYFVSVVHDKNVAVTVSDSQSLTWHALTVQTSTLHKSRLYWATGSGSSAHTFTVSGTASLAAICVQAYRNVAASPFDQENGGAAVGTVLDYATGSVTPSMNNEVLIACLGFDNIDTIAVDSSFIITNQVNFSTGVNYGNALAYKIQTTAGAENPDFSWGTPTLASANIATYLNTAIVAGSAVNFDGTNDYVTLGRMSATEGITKMTVMFWANKAATTTLMGFVTKCDLAGDNKGWDIQTSTGSLSGSGANDVIFGVQNNGVDAYGYTTSAPLSNGTWYHIAMVYDGTQTGNAARLVGYVNGVAKTLTFAGTIPAVTDTTANACQVGQFASNTRNFNGSIDEVQIYNVALSAAQVLAKYNNGIGQFGLSSDSGIVGGWHFDENTGPSAADYSGNGNTGTLTNGPTWVAGKVPNTR